VWVVSVSVRACVYVFCLLYCAFLYVECICVCMRWGWGYTVQNERKNSKTNVTHHFDSLSLLSLSLTVVFSVPGSSVLS
jgi:hypothetical protein